MTSVKRPLQAVVEELIFDFFADPNYMLKMSDYARRLNLAYVDEFGEEAHLKIVRNVMQSIRNKEKIRK